MAGKKRSSKSTSTPKSQQNNQSSTKRKVRWGVIGLGYISQIAVLPAFAHAENCSLEALISGDKEKLDQLGSKYEVKNLYTYSQFDDCLRSDVIDALYIALPNSMHCDATCRAANAGIHVLCEKPMAVTVQECIEMLDTCRSNGVKLMIAYRLQHEEANLNVRELVQSEKIGDLVAFNSTFSMQVAKDNIRTCHELGGGALYDLGIYCINAARTFFGAEPRSVFGMISNPRDERFRHVDGLTSGVLEFDHGKLANFVASFASADVATYELVGTEGSILVRNAYEYSENIQYEITVEGKTKKKTFPKRDQFAPQLIRFSEHVLNDTEPVPSGEEGLRDVRVINALYRSAELGERIQLRPLENADQPSQPFHFIPAVKPPDLFHAVTPSLQN